MKSMIGVFAVCAMIGCVDAGGSKGPPGPQGDAGAQGPQGPMDFVFERIQCGGQGVVGGNMVAFRYQTDQFLDGSVFVTAEVIDASQQSSGSLFFVPTQEFYNTTPVVVGLDILAPADFGYWVLSLDRTTLVVSASYEDEELASLNLSDPYVITLPAEDCTRTVCSAPQ